MLSGLTTAIQTGLTAIGTVARSLVNSNGQLYVLLPVVGLSIALGIVGWAIHKIKTMTWGF